MHYEKDKRRLLQKKCIDFKRNTSKLWKMINRITNKTTDKMDMIDYLKVGNINTYNAKEITKEFARYSSTIGGNFANKIESSRKSIHEYMKNIPQNPTSLFFEPTSQNEIVTIIHGMPSKNSSGYDDISNNLLKSFHKSVALQQN